MQTSSTICSPYFVMVSVKKKIMSQLMKLWHLSLRRPAKAQIYEPAHLRSLARAAEPSLFTHMKYGSTCRHRVRPKLRQLAPLDAAHARLKNEFTEDEKNHNLLTWLN